ncbi:hypothetical protein ACX80D_11960 [Arthrobacter sp. Sr24]
MDQCALVSRTFIPAGDNLMAYDGGGAAARVSRVVAHAELCGIHARRVKGASSPLASQLQQDFR